MRGEAALEAGLIATLRQMGYEYVQITERQSLCQFQTAVEIHNKTIWRKLVVTHLRMKSLKIVIYLEVGARFEKAKETS